MDRSTTHIHTLNVKKKKTHPITSNHKASLIQFEKQIKPVWVRGCVIKNVVGRPKAHRTTLMESGTDIYQHLKRFL